MATISLAKNSSIDDSICQGDIFRNVKYSYIDLENDEGVEIVEFEFPYAIIVSQACDVIAMEELITKKQGKMAKFMPSVLLCPIYDIALLKSGESLTEIFKELDITTDKEPLFFSDDTKIAQKDWHYRFHALSINVDEENVLKNAVVDFKHYFSVPMNYLIRNKSNRVLHLDDLFAEQITLKFATYLSRVAIP